jgi:hypothetical protein
MIFGRTGSRLCAAFLLLNALKVGVGRQFAARDTQQRRQLPTDNPMAQEMRRT